MSIADSQEPNPEDSSPRIPDQKIFDQFQPETQVLEQKAQTNPKADETGNN